MLNFELRYATNPIDARNYGTDELRKHFLVDKLFVDNTIQLTYSMYDRLIVGGSSPVSKSIKLESIPYLKSEHFLDRRELGVINVGEKGKITVDGAEYILEKKEALYIGKGVQNVIFSPVSNSKPLFYINSAPAHKAFPTKKIGFENADVVHMGDDKLANKRVINKLIVNSLVETCQLQMGLTQLLPGNVWNTMPSHTHARRMEAYFYFDIEKGQAVCHFMGEPQNTRHIFMDNNQAVLSPEWSIHSGVGTASYSFIWGMAGENLDYGDMDIVQPNELR